jgi:hypothetical protein
VKTGMVNPSTLVTKRPWNWPWHSTRKDLF